MSSIRKVLFWLHLISGVLAGVFIFIMCVTGALLAFQANILEFVERDQRYVAVDGTTPLSVDALLANVYAARPNAKPSGITFSSDPGAAATVALGREGSVFVNPYTGAITGEGAKSWRATFRTIEDLHRWLALPGEARGVGKWLNDAGNLLFLFLAVSGVYIWFPRKLAWRRFAPVIWFRRTHSGRARDFNWHNVIGFWTSSVLVVLTLTGVIISYQWAGNLLYTLTGNEVPVQQQGGGGGGGPQAPPSGEQNAVAPSNLDALFSRAKLNGTWKTASLRLPLAGETAVFTIDEGIYPNRFGRSTLTLNAATGEVVKWEPYGNQNAARRLRSWARFTHTGESFGLVGQIVAFIACLGGAVLVYTGMALALRRFSGWRKRDA